ncbi:hypothetical protein O0550_23315 [Brevibacillus halotolerans]|uniref:hypothetical protein n=1 Tax=Brevibacillus TaxID=55080 RepID=UPI00215CC9C7|nr:hypothetical protein [Brevibacillus laterosporus]MCR8966079.1 hypothetical protein [Brevibacillus laterosporus]MCZ0838236.1 hypothetical protein [Brevibacillus halotolerans]
METLPNWFWIIYYLFLLTTLKTALSSLVKKQVLRIVSSFTIIFVCTIPLIGLIHSIERQDGLNEFEYFRGQLQQGEMWTIYSIVGYVYLLVWWGLVIRKEKIN